MSPISGLRAENIKSHLQKYRIEVTRGEVEFLDCYGHVLHEKFHEGLRGVSTSSIPYDRELSQQQFATNTRPRKSSMSDFDKKASDRNLGHEVWSANTNSSFDCKSSSDAIDATVSSLLSVSSMPETSLSMLSTSNATSTTSAIDAGHVFPQPSTETNAGLSALLVKSIDEWKQCYDQCKSECMSYTQKF